MAMLETVLALLGGVVLLSSLAAQALRGRSYLPSELMIATVIGVAVGPLGLDLLRIDAVAEPIVVLHELARLTLAIAVMSIALKLPETYVADRARPPLLLVGPGMVLVWLVGSVLTALFVPVSVGVALLVGAIVTPPTPSSRPPSPFVHRRPDSSRRRRPDAKDY